MKRVCVVLVATLLWTLSAAAYVTAFEDDGAITVDGKRTFIIGSYAAAKSDRPYAELAEAGFNLVNAAPDKMDAAHEAGLMTWTAVGTMELGANQEASAQKLTAAVDAIKNHPSLAFIESVDEPAWDWMKTGPRIAFHSFAEAYGVVKTADPNHLMYMNQAPTNLVKTLRSYNTGTDITACDIYPVNPGGLQPMYALFPDGHQGDLNNEHISQVGEYVDKMRQVTGPSRPLFMVLQAFAWADLKDEMPLDPRREEKVLYPTYTQTRFMAFQSIIKGANGIVYWGSHTMPQPSQCWTDIKRVVREVADLAPVIAERAAPVTVSADYIEMGHSVDDGVQIMARQHADKLYVLTCNADKNVCKATLAGLGNWAKCIVLNESRELPVEVGTITDTWRPFDVHVYEFSN